MGALRLPAAALALLLALLFPVDAGKNFWLFRQHILQQREKHAAEAYGRLGLLKQGTEGRAWSFLGSGSIRQPLDHFSWQDRHTFNQRFWVNALYWRPGGPVFLYIGGESALSKYDVLWGHHVEMARKYGALVVALEHRFYGASLNPDGLEDHNLRFLTSQQALADFLPFRDFITQKYKLTLNNTWICFGGSYPGNLAAWFRLKYPHLVFAAVASSAPVRAQLDFTGYDKVVAASLVNPVVGGSRECLEAVAEAFFAVESLVHAGQLARLAKDFHSCQALQGMDDSVFLLSNLADYFMGAVQYDGEGASEWGSVASVCAVMTNASIGSAYQRLITVNSIFLHRLLALCLDSSYAAWLETLRSTQVLESSMMRQWLFQTCTEFGYYQTCEDSSCPFSRLLTLANELRICSAVYNVSASSVREAVTFTNDYYGADHPKASRVLFVNGDIDPWHVLSVLQNQTRSERAILISGTAHCADMLASTPSDPLPLVQAREQISAQVGQWLELARRVPQGL
ncbi:thymus-specific serine protease-like [Varanus komodoensis]|uniref:thymus-specific serine protease-like n=1 Tax=Varanus komodoensis TaxID=61221 RepID=UPI001CF789EE|nr:thymus-specific serine protease-like [Varanus komodoensis]